MSCSYNTLYIGPEGYVVRCKECGHYRVAFISTELTLSEDSFQEFFRKVAHFAGMYNAANSSNVKSISIATFADGIHLLLTSKEVQQLFLMLDTADNEMKATELMNLFYSI
ncbi:MAG: hypothetical protein QM725_11235 [Lacibacter sp.]